MNQMCSGVAVTEHLAQYLYSEIEIIQTYVASPRDNLFLVNSKHNL